jgi:hypothetical protein
MSKKIKVFSHEVDKNSEGSLRAFKLSSILKDFLGVCHGSSNKPQYAGAYRRLQSGSELLKTGNKHPAARIWS